MTSERVVVVGAGVSGLAAARELAPDHDVVVIDAGGVAADTTSRASGVLSLGLEPVSDATREHALATFRRLDGRGVFSFTEHPTVRLVPADESREETPAGGDYLDVDGLRERFPGSFGDLSGYDGGLVYGDTGTVDPFDLAVTLKHLAEQAGAAVYRDTRVTGLRVADGAVAGVDTEHGPVDADHVVYATGWRTRELLADHVELPMRPLRWNALVLEADDPLPESFPMGSVPGYRAYWRPMPGGRVLIGGNEHLVDDPEAAPRAVDDDFRAETVEELVPLLAGENWSVRREDCCPTADAASPDGLPIVDAPAEGPDGLVVACAHHGRGVMLSPTTGAAVRARVTGEPAPFDLSPFALDRFADRSADFEYRSHWED